MIPSKNEVDRKVDQTIIELKPLTSLKRVQLLNDGVPGILLLFNGLSSFSNGPNHPFITYLNILTGTAMLIVMAREMKQGHGIETSRIGWFDVFAGAVMIVGAIDQYKPYKSFQPATLYL
jgi:hypothetical protein